MAISLFDEKSGQVYDAPDEATAQAQIRAYGLTQATPEQVAAHDAQLRSGGTLDKLQTVPETAAATIAESLTGATQAITGGKVVGKYGEAFSPEAVERRQVNPGAAMVGALIPDAAAQLIVPGSGVASLAGRAVLGGITAEGAETAMEGGDYSLGDAALYGLAAGTLEAGGGWAFGKAMKAAGKTKNALDGAVDKARRWATQDALGEPDAALRGLKLGQDDVSEALYAQHQVEFDDAMSQIDARVAAAPDKIFSPSALRKTVSDNAAAQSEHFLEVAVQLQHAAEVSGSVEVGAARNLMQDALETNGPQMYRAIRDARVLLETAELADSKLAADALQALDDSLRNEGMWGKAAKNYKAVAEPLTNAGPKSVGARARPARVHDLDAREAVAARLDAQQSVATATGDKKLAKQIARARKALAQADEVTGARVMNGDLPTDVWENTNEGRALRNREPGPSERGGIWNKAKNYVNEIGEEELGGVVEGAFKKTGMALGGAVAGVPGMAGGYLVGRALNRKFGPQATAFAWRALKKGATSVAKENPLRAAAGLAGAVVGGGITGGGLGVAGGAYAGQRIAKGASDVAKRVVRKVTKAGGAGGEATSKRIWNAVREAAQQREGAAASKAAEAGGMRWTQTAPGESVDEYLARQAKMRGEAPKRVEDMTPEERANVNEAFKKRQQDAAARTAAGPADAKGVKVKSRPFEPGDGPGDVPGVEYPFKSADEGLSYEERSAQMAERARAAAEAAPGADAATESLGKKALKALADNPSKIAGAALLGASALTDEGQETEAMAAANVGLLALFLPSGGRRQLASQLDEAMSRLPFHERAPMRQAARQAMEENEELLRKFAKHELGEMTADEVMLTQGKNVLSKFEEMTGRSVELEDMPPEIFEAISTNIDYHNGAVIENDAELLRLARVGHFDALPGGGQPSLPFAERPRDLERFGMHGPADTRIHEVGETPLQITGEHQTVSGIRRWEEQLGKNLDHAQDALQEGDMPHGASQALEWSRQAILNRSFSYGPRSAALEGVERTMEDFADQFVARVNRTPNARELAYAKASLEHRAGGYWAGNNIARLHVAQTQNELGALRAARDAGEDIGRTGRDRVQAADDRDAGIPEVMRDVREEVKDELLKSLHEKGEELGRNLHETHMLDTDDIDALIEAMREHHGELKPSEEVFLRQELGQDVPPSRDLREMIDEGLEAVARYEEIHSYDIADIADLDVDDVVRQIENGETNFRGSMTPWEEFHLRENFEARQERYQQRFRDHMEEQLDFYRREAGYDEHGNPPDSSPPSSQPDSSPDSDLESDPGGREPNVYDGLPADFGLKHIGLEKVDMHDRAGVPNVFGDDLSIRDMKDMFALEHFKTFAEKSGAELRTRLEVHQDEVKFSGRAGELSMDTIYTRAPGGGVNVDHKFMQVPKDMQGRGVMRDIVKPMIQAFERKGANKVTVETAIDVGRHAWAALGLRPKPEAELKAAEALIDSLDNMGVHTDAVAGLEAKIHQAHLDKTLTLMDVADATIPLSAVEHLLPAMEEKIRGVVGSHLTGDIDLKKGFISGDQFKIGKAFLLATPGEWNHGLSIKIDRNDPHYRKCLMRLGLLGAAGLTGAETLRALDTSKLTFSERDEDQAQAPQMDPAMRAELAEQAAQAQQAQQTKAQLDYLRGQKQNAIDTTARALASPAKNTRTVLRAPGLSNSAGVQTFMGSQKNLNAAFDEKKATLAKLQKDPMILVEEMTDSLGHLQDAAPDLHRQVVAQTYKVASFLAEKMPGTIGASLTRPEGSPVSALAVRQFALYYSAATEPSTVLTDLTNNRAQKEQVDTLKELWPDTYAELKTSIIDQMSQGRPPTFQQRQRLDLLFDFGDSLDAGLSNRLVATLDAYKQTPQGKGEGGPNGKGAPPKMPTRQSQPSTQAMGALGSLSHGAARAA